MSRSMKGERGGRAVPRSKQRRKQGRGTRGLILGVLGGVAAVALVVGIIALRSGGGKGSTPGDVSSQSVALPQYVVYSPPQVQEAYSYAAAHPEVLQYMPCYCGCGMHSGHLSNWNCFIQSMPSGQPIVWDPHGST